MRMMSNIPIHRVHMTRFLQYRLTNENEAHSDDVRQQVAPERFIVFAITFSKESNKRVEFVLTQTLPWEKWKEETTKQRPQKNKAK